MTTSGQTGSPEPRPILPFLAPFYVHARDLSWLIIRLTVGGTLLVHGIQKLMGSQTIAAFAANSMAKRGIEPSLVVAYLVWFNETVGAACVMLGLFTRFVAASIAIELAVIAFLVMWPNGFGWSQRGWEYMFLWGLIFFAIALRGGGPYSLDRKLGWEL
jgi:putative oxidoreductase